MDRAEAGATAAKAKSLTIPDFLRVIWGTPTVWMLMAAFMCANFVALVLLTWMPTYLNRQFGMSLAMSGLNATIYVQLASMCAAPLGGWLADRMRMWTPGGRMLVQALGVLGGAPFVALCGLTHSVLWLLVALTCWGFFKGLYDANIFASVYDVIRPEARGTAAGFMNTVGWLAGGGTAPVIIGMIAQSHGLSLAIATASIVYVFAGLFLLIGVFFFVKRDSARMQASVAA
jgi:sugar phosphate permease